MNLRDLEYLVALDEERHFQRAADRCYVSQPTLSGQIKKLEGELNVSLVERSGRKIAMTEAGLAIAGQARRVLADTRTIRELAASFRNPMEGDLHMGVIPTVAPYLLPLFIPHLRRRFPGLKLFLHEHQTAVLLRKLRDAELEVLLLALPVETDEFVENDLFREPFLLTVADDHPLAERDRASLDLLKDLEVMLLEEGHCMRGQALDVCLTAGAREHRGFRGTSLETLRQMAAEGIGITLMPKLATLRERNHEGSIRYIPFEEPEPTRRIGLLYRKGSYREESFAAIGEVIREAVTTSL
ncbi:DNA-binding transcriptional regulator OxyR [Thiohalomonas denitrificans]|uniref:LysR family transcriptional regulator, hydrogen peroxide-inducible genes activator n=1 Tax=Thiohalomonas denitrificans TaxID=415747 RepID=A0A1G5Q3A3_9GAMM|nr:DNA-binding transcriptional regulator OxyR [Thiohalomonas denitrificans]SCZ56293.1 LysR family transcriptional regulator, hydrogen peroxide-inducible genes activator [Thiohalomonas denitrificans]